MKPIDQASIRIQNMVKLWEALQHQGEATRQTLAEMTGLSLMTVSNLVDCLQRNQAIEGYLVSNGRTGGRRMAGRRAEVIHPRREGLSWLMLDLSDPFFRYSMWSVTGQVLHISEPFDFRPDKAYQDNLNSFLTGLKRFLDSNPLQHTVLGAAVISPGPYHEHEDRIYNKRIPELNQIPIKACLKEFLALEHVYVEEDVKLAVCAYLQEPGNTSDSPLYYLYLGEGVGGATLCRGEVLRGLNAAAGDAGQLMAANGKPYENQLSLRAFARELGLEAKEQTNPEQIMQELQHIANACAEAFDRCISQISNGVVEVLSSVIWLTDPKTIVVDCRYLLRSRALFLEGITKGIAQRFSGAIPRLPALRLAPENVSIVFQGALRVLNREWMEQIVYNPEGCTGK